MQRWLLHQTFIPQIKHFLRKVLEVNTIAPFALIKAALPYLTEQHGCVLNIGSVNACSGEPNLFAYSISKGALNDHDEKSRRYITSEKMVYV